MTIVEQWHRDVYKTLDDFWRENLLGQFVSNKTKLWLTDKVGEDDFWDAYREILIERDKLNGTSFFQ